MVQRLHWNWVRRCWHLLDAEMACEEGMHSWISGGKGKTKIDYYKFWGRVVDDTLLGTTLFPLIVVDCMFGYLRPNMRHSGSWQKAWWLWDLGKQIFYEDFFIYSEYVYNSIGYCEVCFYLLIDPKSCWIWSIYFFRPSYIDLK